jgi:SAM-dependent methyltransferase
VVIGWQVRVARDFSTHSRNIRFIEADFINWPGEADYDAIAMIAVLHHLPFDTALSKARSLLRPGGVLLVVGLHREANPIHFIVRGAVGRSVSLFYHAVRRTAPVGAPIREPSMTLDEIRRLATTVLPGASIERHVLWRYSLVWRKPDPSQACTPATS